MTIEYWQVPSANIRAQGAFDNPAEDAEAAAMRTAGLGGPWTPPAPWTPRTRPPRLGNRCAISSKTLLVFIAAPSVEDR
jgi:hypothetical protein